MVQPKKCIIKMEPYKPPNTGRLGALRLDFNENTAGCSPKAMEALRKITSEELSAYPEYSALTRKLANYLSLSEEELIPTNGSDEAIKLVMDVYLEKGDEVVLAVPTFAMFGFYARIAGARIREIPYQKDLSFPGEKFLDSITGKTRMVILVNPNNPTGTSVDDAVITAIIKKAKNAIVLLDEAYYQYAGNSFKGKINEFENLIIIQTFSKAFGLAGLRIGYIISNRKNMSYVRKAASPYSVNSVAAKLATAALDDVEFVERYVKEVSDAKNFLSEEMGNLGIKTFPTDANFLLADFGINCDYVFSGLKSRGILVRNVSGYPMLEGFLRIGVGTKEQASRFLKTLREVLRSRAILFDMDGILVDVGGSYRKSIQETVKFFTGTYPTDEAIRSLKNTGNYNNDWKLSFELIRRKVCAPELKTVIGKFQEFYSSYKTNERWLVDRNLLISLKKRYALGVVTGRPKKEALYALQSAGTKELFETLIAMDDVGDRLKPDPYGIQLAVTSIGVASAVYIGDSVEDIIAAKNAGIESIGVTSDSITKTLLLREGAKDVLDDVARLSEVLK
ncbi:MAG: histidinol-phosphate transaminase [Candidatus Aenigmarchaeota archaeon]|nr:histidinol-phosphate transaminase [Candidatus Aenigmarchaeota archaeon]